MKLTTPISALVLIVLIIFYFSAFTVKETQNAIVLRLGKIQTNAEGKPAIYQPGLHFKIPFITSVSRFDMRLRNLDMESSQIITKEQKSVIVDAFVKWRISDIVEYYKATSADPMRVDRLLQQKVSDAIRAEIGQQTILELIAGKRDQVMNLISEKTSEVAKSLGIRVIDVRINRIDLPDSVSASIYKRMRSEREKEASLLRSEGREASEQIRAKADADVTVLLADAKSQALKIQAQGQAQAAAIYAKSYRQDPQFYEFYRSLLAYQQVFSHTGNTLVIQANNPFLKYFKA